MMHKTTIQYSLLIASIIALHNVALHASVSPTFVARSQSFQGARYQSGLYEISSSNRGILAITPTYTRSTNAADINECLFGRNVSHCCSGIRITGSSVANRTPGDWLADYFYLPTDFISNITFEPQVDNFIVDTQWRLHIDSCFKGLYLDIYVPLVHTRWNLDMHETVTFDGVRGHDRGYFTPENISNEKLFTQFKQYASGQALTPIEHSLDAASSNPALIRYITILRPLQKAKMSCDRLVKTRAADLRANLGIQWDCLLCSKMHWELRGHVAVPTGNKYQGNYLFEPIAGNGHHWEGGAGLHGTYDLACNNETNIMIHLDGLVTHLFSSTERRTFDLKEKPFSRYMLAARFTNPVRYNLKGNGIPPTFQFAGEYTPVANLTNILVSSKTTIQGDISLFATIHRPCYDFTIGYNFWGRTCEDLEIRCPDIISNDVSGWALKGDARMFGYGAITPQAVALSATQSAATIHSNLNGPGVNPPLGVPTSTNAIIDNPELATGLATSENLVVTVMSPLRTHTSIQPQFITLEQIDICSAPTGGLSSTVFGHASRTWNHLECWKPFMGVGASVEFAHNRMTCNITCPRCALSQWSIWLKTGAAF